MLPAEGNVLVLLIVGVFILIYIGLWIWDTEKKREKRLKRLEESSKP